MWYRGDRENYHRSRWKVQEVLRYGDRERQSSYGAKRDTMYTEIEIERGDEACNAEKKAESDHQNHKHIERKIYGPLTPVNFF